MNTEPSSTDAGTTASSPTTLGPYRLADALVACTGATAGKQFLAGATIGQDHHSGTTAGSCHG